MARKGMSISISGVPECQGLIRQVKELLNSETVQNAILPAAYVVRDIAIRLVNQGPGLRKDGSRRLHLKELIFATKGRRRKSFISDFASSIYGEVGPSVIAGVDLKKAPHAHLVEFGHAQWAGGSRRKGKGHKIGQTEAHPFIRPAVIAARPRVAAIIEAALRQLLAPFNSR